jgi:hypothetical protein
MITWNGENPVDHATKSEEDFVNELVDLMTRPIDTEEVE